MLHNDRDVQGSLVESSELLPHSKRGVVLSVVVAAAIVVLPIGVALL